MNKFEKIAELLEGAEQDCRRQTARDIVSDLADFAKTCEPDQRAGLRFAIDVIKENYL